MKKILIGLAAAALMFAGCTKDLEQRVDQLETDVEQLQSGLDALKKAVEDKLTVEDYKQIEGGYELIMSNGTKLYLYNGADGAKGDKGDTGAQGEKGDKGDTGAQGEKGDKGDTGAQGEKGDKGDTGAQGEKGDKGDTGETGATGPQGEKGEDGDAFFESVELSEDGAYLVITLIDGTVYNLPMGGFNIVFDVVDYEGLAGEVVTVPYTLAGVKDGEQVYVRILAASNCTAEVEASAVKVTLAEGEGYVDLYALNNTTGELKARTLEFTAEGIKVGATEFTVSPLGGDVEVPVTTAQDYEVKIEGSWLAYAETKAVREETIVLHAEENTGANDLKATVKLVAGEKVLASFDVTQKNYNPGLLNKYTQTYAYYGQPYSGELIVELSDDYSKGTYKVSGFLPYLNYDNTVKSYTMYADFTGTTLTLYAAGAVSGYYGKVEKDIALNVSEDYVITSQSDIKVGYYSLTDFKALVPQGPAVLTEAEEAVCGFYNETYTYASTYGTPSNVSNEKGMHIYASDEAAYGQLKVVCMTYSPSYGTYSMTCYADLSEDGKELILHSKGVVHAQFSTADTDYTLVIGENGALSCESLTFNSEYTNITGYTASPVVENVGGDEPGDASLSKFEGTYAQTCNVWNMDDSTTMTVSVSGDKLVLTGFLALSFMSHPGGTYEATLSEDGTVLTLTNELSASYFNSVVGVELSVSETGGKITLSSASFAVSSSDTITNYSAVQQ